MILDVTGILVPDRSLVLGIAAAAFACNLPLGYLREGARKFSAGWFLYVHLSVPLIAWLRVSNRLSPWVIPIFILCAVAGQLIGGRLRRARGRRA